MLSHVETNFFSRSKMAKLSEMFKIWNLFVSYKRYHSHPTFVAYRYRFNKFLKHTLGIKGGIVWRRLLLTADFFTDLMIYRLLFFARDQQKSKNLQFTLDKLVLDLDGWSCKLCKTSNCKFLVNILSLGWTTEVSNIQKIMIRWFYSTNEKVLLYESTVVVF